MSCDCGSGNYLDCGVDNKTITLDQGSLVDQGSQTFEHNFNHVVEATNLPIAYLEKTDRKFKVTYSHDFTASGSEPYVVACDEGYTVCEEGSAESNKSFQANVSEHCIREINTPYYLDRLNNIFVYKNQREELLFEVDSDKHADFKVKWGTASHNKICLPKTIRTRGTEKFIVVKDGIERVLAETAYEYFPFPVNDMDGGTWGLYGNVTHGTIYDTPDVGLILIFPLVGKQAMPLDNDVKYYNFYDYNAMEGGFVENGLSKDDGGKDYFYPYWCRMMPTDKLWRRTADERWQALKSGTVMSSGSYTVDEPEVYALPFGSFAVDGLDNFIYSCLCQFSDRAGGSGVVVNYSSFGDLFKAIYTDNKIENGVYNDFYPVSPL